jgi:NADH dehydrogenase
LKKFRKKRLFVKISVSVELLTIVVAGGGPTGVEVSGMFAEMKKT